MPRQARKLFHQALITGLSRPPSDGGPLAVPFILSSEDGDHGCILVPDVIAFLRGAHPNHMFEAASLSEEDTQNKAKAALTRQFNIHGLPLLRAHPFLK